MLEIPSSVYKIDMKSVLYSVLNEYVNYNSCKDKRIDDLSNNNLKYSSDARVRRCTPKYP